MIKTATILYFSPTKGTKKLVKQVAKGIQVQEIIDIDITRPGIRNGSNSNIKTDLLIVGLPVYVHDIPSAVKPYLATLKGNNIPTILIAVYGNVSAGFALKTMENILEQKGFQVIAAATFIAEHSFAHEKLPLAINRPDEKDMQMAMQLGEQVREKIEKHDLSIVSMPGNGNSIARAINENSVRLFTKQPEVDINKCTRCGTCVDACPIPCIDPATLLINEKECIRCFACVKLCPEKARRIELKNKLVAKQFFSKALRKRRGPRFYF